MSRALIVIDVQNDYFAGGFLPLFDAESVEEKIIATIGRAKAMGDRIVLIRHISASAAGLFARGGDGSLIRPAILDAAGDVPVVIKQVADAFQDTDLLRQLLGVDTLLICGMMTQNCVAFTALSEAGQAFDTQVIGDLCAAPNEIVHKIALNAIASKRRLVLSTEIWG